jgi:hypothetical protein
LDGNANWRERRIISRWQVLWHEELQFGIGRERKSNLGLELVRLRDEEQELGGTQIVSRFAIAGSLA